MLRFLLFELVILGADRGLKLFQATDESAELLGFRFRVEWRRQGFAQFAHRVFDERQSGIGHWRFCDRPRAREFAVTFVFACLVILFNLIADVLYGWLDPRISYR